MEAVTTGDFSIGSAVWPGLAKLVEEAGEVVQAAMKLVALAGAENYDHWDGTDVRVRLRDEVADLQAAINFLVEHNYGAASDLVEYTERVAAKQRRFNGWHSEQSP